MDNSVITCDKTIAEIKTFPTNVNEKKSVCKTQNFYILFAFLLITVVLLIAFRFYFHLIKY